MTRLRFHNSISSQVTTRAVTTAALCIAMLLPTACGSTTADQCTAAASCGGTEPNPGQSNVTLTVEAPTSAIGTYREERLGNGMRRSATSCSVPITLVAAGTGTATLEGFSWTDSLTPPPKLSGGSDNTFLDRFGSRTVHAGDRLSTTQALGWYGDFASDFSGALPAYSGRYSYVITYRSNATVRTATYAVSCAPDPATIPIPVATVSIEPGPLSLAIGATAPLTATATAADGSTLSMRTATWASSVPSVASVSTAGLVTAGAAGTTTISATIDNITASVVVTVAVAGVATIDLPTGFTTELEIGQQMRLTPRDKSGAPITSGVTWRSSNTTIIAVSDTGWIEAKATGSADVTAALNGVGLTQGFTVVVPNTGAQKSPWLEFVGSFCGASCPITATHNYQRDPIVLWSENNGNENGLVLVGYFKIHNMPPAAPNAASPAAWIGYRTAASRNCYEVDQENCVYQGDMKIFPIGLDKNPDTYYVCMSASMGKKKRVGPWPAEAGYSFYNFNLQTSGGGGPIIDIQPLFEYASSVPKDVCQYYPNLPK